MATCKDRKISLKEYSKIIIKIQNPKYIFTPKDYKISESKQTFYLNLFIKVFLFFIAYRILEANNYFDNSFLLWELLLLVIAVIVVYSFSEILHWLYAKFDLFEASDKK